MIMADENQVDARQLMERQARRAHAFRPRPGDGAGALGIDRVGQQIDTSELQQERGMIDERGGDITGDKRRRQRGLEGGGDVLRPLFSLAGSKPAENVPKAATGGAGWVVESLPIKSRAPLAIRLHTRRTLQVANGQVDVGPPPQVNARDKGGTGN